MNLLGRMERPTSICVQRRRWGDAHSVMSGDTESRVLREQELRGFVLTTAKSFDQRSRCANYLESLHRKHFLNLVLSWHNPIKTALKEKRHFLHRRRWHLNCVNNFQFKILYKININRNKFPGYWHWTDKWYFYLLCTIQILWGSISLNTVKFLY